MCAVMTLEFLWGGGGFRSNRNVKYLCLSLASSTIL